MRITPVRRLGAAVAVAALLVAGCSGKAGQQDSGTDGGGVRTGPGVTADTITVGALTDESGVFAAQGKTIALGNRLYLDKVNAAGGVCGRKLNLLEKDHGYNVQKAVSLYAELQSQVLGLVQLLGSPIFAALSQQISDDRTLTVSTGWSATLLKNPHMVIIGNTYDVETVNGIDYLAKEKGLKSGDVIGHIYFEGDFGNNALQGTKYAAGKLGLTVEAIQIKATDTDMTAQVTRLKQRGVKAIVLSIGPRQTASVASVAASVGFAVPLLANTPAFDPSLLDTPAKAALEANLTVVQPYAPYAADAPGPKEVAAAVTARPDTKPNSAIGLGYASAQVFVEVLKRACAAEDLTRDGLATAFRQLTSIDTGGLTPVLNYAAPGRPSSRETYVLKVDSKVPGGLATIHPAAETDLAKDYTPAT